MNQLSRELIKMILKTYLYKLNSNTISSNSLFSSTKFIKYQK